MIRARPRFSRRTFIVGAAAVGGGLAIGLRFPFATDAGPAKPEVNAWVVIEPDERVIIRIARSEMGQGTLTGLAQLVAEELDCDWSKVSTEYPTPAENLRRKGVWGEFATSGSCGIRESHEYVRAAGAMARTLLVAAAAGEWNVSPTQCTASAGVITHGPSGRTTTYGKMAAAAARLDPPRRVALRDPKDWKIAGKPLRRLDTLDKVTGRQVYGADLQLPGLLNATIRECPVFGGKLKRFDAAQVSTMKGVRKVIAVGDTAVAVVADTWWQAKAALDALPIDWDYGPAATTGSAEIGALVASGLADGPAFTGNQAGDVKAALAGAARTIEATYSYPFQVQAPMEPMNCTALYTADRCEVWVPTQDGEASLRAVARTSGLAPERCEVHKLHLGGGFGRRIYQDCTVQAVRIAMQMAGTPVKLLWSREEDMRQGRYHPVTQCRLIGGLDAGGRLTALSLRIAGQSIVGSTRPEVLANGKGDAAAFEGLNAKGQSALGYAIPNLLTEFAMRNTHVPVGYWRGVNINQNAIYLECFIDELAAAAGSDPLVFRRTLLASAPKHLAVLNAAADRAGWDTPAPAGRHRGLAQMKAYDTYVAACAELSVVDGVRVKLHRFVCAIDPGHAVNPAQIERQVAGSLVYGLSALFNQEITLKDGRVEQSNFDTYDSLRLAQMPRVESIVMPSGGFWGGIGEPAIGVAAPAVLNALYRATGRRLRSVPLKHHGLRLA